MSSIASYSRRSLPSPFLALFFPKKAIPSFVQLKLLWFSIVVTSSQKDEREKKSNRNFRTASFVGAEKAGKNDGDAWNSSFCVETSFDWPVDIGRNDKRHERKSEWIGPWQGRMSRGVFV